VVLLLVVVVVLCHGCRVLWRLWCLLQPLHGSGRRKPCNQHIDNIQETAL
jgi:hypothetical protein